MKQRNCIIGQSGGPTVAINASLAGIIAKALSSNQYGQIYGAVNGIQGFLEGNYIRLDETFSDSTQLNHLMKTPAMYLGSCRYKLPTLESLDTDSNSVKIYETIFKRLEDLEITDFFYIGGNDSMDTVMKLSGYASKHNKDIHFIGVPKTIDNDLFGTDHTPGFGSAAKFVASSMLEVIYDSRIYHTKSVTIVEIMGRNAGWLTAAAALARTADQLSPDLIYLPEVPFSKEQFIQSLNSLLKTKENVIVAVSEGIRDANGNFLDHDESCIQKDAFGHIIHSGTGKILENLVANEIGCKVRSIELNVLQRCAMHIASKTDLDESFAVGQGAVAAALENKTAVMMTMHRVESAAKPYAITIDAIDITKVANLEQKVPVEWINETGDDILEPLYDYLRPLIQGEVIIGYADGIPHYIKTPHLH